MFFSVFACGEVLSLSTSKQLAAACPVGMCVLVGAGGAGGQADGRVVCLFLSLSVLKEGLSTSSLTPASVCVHIDRRGPDFSFQFHECFERVRLLWHQQHLGNLPLNSMLMLACFGA